MNLTMKRLGLSLAAAMILLAALLGSCARKELTVVPPWEAGEKSVYEIKRDGEVLAVWEMRVESDEAGIALVSEMKGEGFREEARVKVDPRSLLPEAVSFTQETGSTKSGYTATYTTEEAIVTPEPPDGQSDAPPVRIAVPHQGPHFENESFIMILRAMPLEKGFKASVTDVITRNGTVATVEVKVVGEEKISTVLGDLEAYVVELTGYSQFAWIAKDAPRQILRFENKAAGTVSELVTYQPK